MFCRALPSPRQGKTKTHKGVWRPELVVFNFNEFRCCICSVKAAATFLGHIAAGQGSHRERGCFRFPARSCAGGLIYALLEGVLDANVKLASNNIPVPNP